MLKASLIAILGAALTGCVSSRKYNDVVHAYENLDQVNQGLAQTVEEMQNESERMRVLLEEARISEETVRAQMAAEQRRHSEMEALVQGIGGISVTDAGGLRMDAEILFDSGKAELKPTGQRLLRDLAERLRTRNELIRIDGHTDAQPINRSRDRFPTNWHLSAARAASVLQFLETSGIPPERMFLAGHGPYRPADVGRTPDPRRPVAKDRRVEIFLIPRAGGGDTPGNGR